MGIIPYCGEAWRLYDICRHLSYNEASEETVSANQALLERITSRPDVFGGKPIIRDLRVSVELVLSLLSQGVTPEAILDDYPDLDLDDIRACTAYARQ